MDTGVEGVIDTGSDIKEGLSKKIEDIKEAEKGATVTIAQDDGTAKETFVPSSSSSGGVRFEDAGNLFAELLPEELSTWLKAFLEAYTFGRGLTASLANYFNMSGTEESEPPPDGPFEDRTADGKLLAKGCRKDGQLDGTYTTFYPNGKPMVVSNYKNGLLNGEYLRLRENGQPKELGAYKNGRKHGKFYTYDENGQITGLSEYKDGEKVPVTLAPYSTRTSRLKKKLLDFIYTHVPVEAVETLGAVQTGWDKYTDKEYWGLRWDIWKETRKHKNNPELCKSIEEKTMAPWKEKHPEKDYTAAWEEANMLAPRKKINKIALATKKNRSRRKKLCKKLKSLRRYAQKKRLSTADRFELYNKFFALPENKELFVDETGRNVDNYYIHAAAKNKAMEEKSAEAKKKGITNAKDICNTWELDAYFGPSDEALKGGPMKRVWIPKNKSGGR